MGTGIGIVAATVAKTDVVMIDANQASLDRSKAFMENLFKKDIAKGKITEADAAAAFARVSFNTDAGALEKVRRPADFVCVPPPSPQCTDSRHLLCWCF
jgi:3-hydroxyacyl-CoA dehydrogenase